MEYNEDQKMVLGYIRANSINDEDYNEIAEIFIKDSKKVPKDSNIREWFYYVANLSIFNYCFDKGKRYKTLMKKNLLQKGEVEYYRALKQRYIYMYKRLLESDIRFNKIFGPNFKSVNFDGEYGLLNDIFKVHKEIIRQDLMSIIAVKSRPHEKLIFCYKNFLDGWSSKEILYRLRKKKLNNLMMSFINEYSQKSGIPSAVVLFHFLPLEDYLEKTNYCITKLNSYFSRVNMKEYLSSREKKLLLKQLVTHRVKIIDKWNERVKYRIIRGFI